MAEPKAWAELRAVVLYRDGYRCQICRDAEATEADHIWPRVAGGPDALGNLQAACKPCNQSKGGRYSLAEATEQQLMWHQNYRNRLLVEAQREADYSRQWVSLYAGGLSGDDRGRVIADVPDDETCDNGDELGLSLSLLARSSWTGGSYGWVTAEQLLETAAERLAEAESRLAAVVAECAAVEIVAARMADEDMPRLVDFIDVKFGRGTS